MNPVRLGRDCIWRYNILRKNINEPYVLVHINFNEREEMYSKVVDVDDYLEEVKAKNIPLYCACIWTMVGEKIESNSDFTKADYGKGCQGYPLTSIDLGLLNDLRSPGRKGKTCEFG